MTIEPTVVPPSSDPVLDADASSAVAPVASTEGAAPKKAPRARRSSAPAPLLSPARAAAAYNRVLAATLAATSEELASVPELDAASAARHVLTALPRLRELRDAIAAALPAHHAETLDSLEDLALGAWFAHARGEIFGTPEFSLDSLETRAAALREELLVAAEVLARRDLLDPARVRALRARVDAPDGDCAADLQTLSELYTWSWGVVHNKTAVTQEEIAEAGELAQRILVARGLREEAAAGADATAVAPRMLARLARAYDDCVRAVTYVRWREGDALEFVPPLAPRRKRAPKTAPAASSGETPSGQPAPEPDESV